MTLQDRINIISELGLYLRKNFLEDHFDSIKIATVKNPWFTVKSITNAVLSISDMVEKDMLNAWLNPYTIKEPSSPKNVLIIMAGNIPLVGFHDLLSVIIMGHNPVIKLSSNDNVLMPLIINIFLDLFPSNYNQIKFINDVKGRSFDAVITTGTDNSANYFKYYFKDAKKIIRKNRRSIAILDGSESSQQIKGLANDIFLYYGLGCRNVSKLYLPCGYDLNILFKSFYSHKHVMEHKKYGNNYDYNKAIFLMGNNKLIENGFILLKEDSSLYSPVAMLYYEYYNDINDVDTFINKNSDKIQCIVSKNNIPFGNTQKPKLWDYADGVDTIDFLKQLA
ncbi:MAG: acyl-CoA reductase [Flavobacteriales bacterium]|nr:acyl-CoA reductase [Flavobacteriales bacterium]